MSAEEAAGRADKEAYEFRLQLLKDEIAAQSNVFDQIDNKTGVALGFSFVVVGQVLTSIFPMSPDLNHFRNLHPYLIAGVFGLANLFIFFAVICGAVSRWPRSFETSIDWQEDVTGSSYLELLTLAVPALEKITIDNERTNTEKGQWAAWTYRFVGLALIAYLVLTALLYFFSAPSAVVH